MYMYNIHFAVEQNKTLVSQLYFDKNSFKNEIKHKKQKNYLC